MEISQPQFLRCTGDLSASFSSSGQNLELGNRSAHRAIDAAETLKEQGYKVGVINKPTLNIVDEETLKTLAASGFVLVAETQNQVTGLGSRFGTWLLERGYTPRYKHLGIAKPGEGGGLEQVGFHGLEPEHLVAAVKELVR